MILHKRAVMVVRTFADDVTSHAIGHVVFEIGVEGLVLAVLDFDVCKIVSTVLSRQWPLLHVDGV